MEQVSGTEAPEPRTMSGSYTSWKTIHYFNNLCSYGSDQVATIDSASGSEMATVAVVIPSRHHSLTCAVFSASSRTHQSSRLRLRDALSRRSLTVARMRRANGAKAMSFLDIVDCRLSI